MATPTAEPFTALGAGNGFPYCLPKVNVAIYDYWTTLGGTQKGSSPSDTDLALEIALSLVNASKLYWNYNGHTLTRNSPIFGTSSVVVDIDEEKYTDLRAYGVDATLPFTPKNRACSRRDWSVRTYNEVPVDTIFQADIVRMYNGDTGNEDNFVGYGTERAFYGYSYLYIPFYFDFRSYADDEESEVFAYAIEYNNSIAGIPLLARSGSIFYNPDYSLTISGLTSTISAPAPAFGEVLPDGILTEELTFSDINFYTY